MSERLLGVTGTLYLGECPHCRQKRWLGMAPITNRVGHVADKAATLAVPAHIIKCPLDGVEKGSKGEV